jgi:hypothetical protein
MSDVERLIEELKQWRGYLITHPATIPMLMLHDECSEAMQALQAQLRAAEQEKAEAVVQRDEAIAKLKALQSGKRCVDCGEPTKSTQYDLCQACEDVFHARECSCHLGSVCTDACAAGKHHDGCHFAARHPAQET